MPATLAPAKVNLFLHVGAPGADGYHPLCSLMAFADFGDRVSVGRGEGRLTVSGPFAAGLGQEHDNLIIRAVRRRLPSHLQPDGLRRRWRPGLDGAG